MARESWKCGGGMRVGREAHPTAPEAGAVPETIVGGVGEVWTICVAAGPEAPALPALSRQGEEGAET